MTAQLTKEQCRSKICDLLELDPIEEQSKKLAHLVLNDGRQALSAHQDDLGGRVFREEIQSTEGQLVNLLKGYTEQIWTENTPVWFQDYLRQQREEMPDLYNQVLLRSINYASKFTKRGLVLSLTIQLVFEFDDTAMLETTVFDEVWKVLVVNGRQGLRQREDDLSGRVFKEQLETPESSLFLALKDYYAEPLRKLLVDPPVSVTRAKTIETTLHCVTEHGWWKGIHDSKVTDEIAKNKLTTIEKKLLEYLKAEGLPIPSDAPTTTATTTTPLLQNSSTASTS